MSEKIGKKLPTPPFFRKVFKNYFYELRKVQNTEKYFVIVKTDYFFCDELSKIIWYSEVKSIAIKNNCFVFEVEL